MVSLSVDVLHGATCPTTTTVTLDTGDSLLVLKKRLCAATGLPATTLKLCCAGKVLLDDDQRIGSLPSTRLTAWGPRFTKLRSDKAFEAAEVQREVAEEQRRAEMRAREAKLERKHGGGVKKPTAPNTRALNATSVNQCEQT